MRQFTCGGKRFIACWDSLPDDPEGTSITLSEFLDDLSLSRIETPICFLDVVDGPTIPGADDEVEASFNARFCGFTSCEFEEVSHAIGSPPRGLWMSLIIEALSGKTSVSGQSNGQVTAASLDAFIAREFPRRLRAAFGPGSVQSPGRFGSISDAILVHMKSSSNQGSQRDPFDARRFSRVVFRGESRSRIKDLSGYRKSFTMPDRATPSNNQFVARMATADLEADLRETFDRAIREYGYKRKDVSVTTERDGTGILRTPDFEYLVHLEIDPDDSSNVIWHREVGQFVDPATVQSPAFDATFGRIVDRLAFEFETPWDVTAFVDRFEESPPKGVTLRAAPDGTSCEIRLQGVAGSIVLEPKGLIVKGKPGAPGDLLALLFRFFATTSPAEPKPALPAKRKSRA